MFVWHDAQKVLLAPAELADGMRVLDFGAGPGFFAQGLAELVGEKGAVDGVDINAQFVNDANQRNHRDNVAFHHLTDHSLPFPDDTFDRVICKNVLEYVPDLTATLAELHRVTKPAGGIHVVDSDWGFVLVYPWTPEQTQTFFRAAAPAFKEPLIGRVIPSRLAQAGFKSAQVQLSPLVDQTGRGLHVLRNMASYIATFDTLPEEQVETMLAQVEATVDNNEFLFCLPQFLVTARK